MFIFAEINCSEGYNLFVCDEVFYKPEIPSVAMLKPGEGKRKKVRYIKDLDEEKFVVAKINYFFDDAEFFDIKSNEKGFKLITKVIKKKKICTLFMTDKTNVPIIWRALAFNM